MKDILTLATVTLLSTASAAYAGDGVAKQLGALEAKPTHSAAATSYALRALDTRMTERKLVAFKAEGVKAEVVTADASRSTAPADNRAPGDNPDKAPLPAQAATMQTLETSKNLHDAIAWNDKLFAVEGVDVAAHREGHMLASWQPAGSSSPAYAAPKGAPRASAKEGMNVTSPFGAGRNEMAVAKTADGEPMAMGGPISGADLVSEGWSTHDADADGGLTRLEFATWVANDADKPDLAIAANEQRDSAEEGTATVRLLNGTSLEFSAADADQDTRVSAAELTAFVDNA